jgi:acetyl esterase
MSTRHLIDPEILPVLDLMPVLDLTKMSLADIRAGAGADRYGEMPAPVVVPETHFAEGRDGAPDVRLLVYNPPSESRNRGAILHIHGGGMILGTADMSQMVYPDIARAQDIVVVSVDYRLAPETPFPGPQEDCYAGLDWLAAHASELGVDLSRVIVMGESAGGGLSAALAQMVRDRGAHQLAGQVLIYPMLDHRTGGADCQHNNPTTGEFIWTRHSNIFGWAALQGSYAVDDTRAGWFSPARATDLGGLPPTFISVGALDLFLDEDMEYARRLSAAGVPVELHVYPGAFHGFNMMPGARLTEQAMRDTLAAVARLTAA